MKRILIVDGYNVIHRVPDLRQHLCRGLAAAREALVRYCGRWRSRRKDISAVYVVFDGDSSVQGAARGAEGGVRTIFTRTGEEADSRILDIIRGGPAGTGYIVVSDDSYVSLTSRRFMASAISVSDFYESPGPPRSGRERAGKGEKEALSPDEEREILEELKREWGIT